MQAWLLLLVAVFMLFGTRLNYVVSSLALQFRQMLPPDHAADLSQQIPRERALPIIERLRAAFPQITQPATLAGLVRQVWERMHVRPPGVIASLLLLTIHGGLFLGTPVAAILFQLPLRSVESGPDGVVKREEVRVWGRLRTSIELDANGRRHGRYVEYFSKTGRVSVEGRYFHGEPEGVWTYYREDGEVDSREEFKPAGPGPMNQPR